MESRSNPLYASAAHRRDKGRVGSLRAMLPYFGPYRLQLIGAAVAILFASGAMLGLGAALRFLVDFGISRGDPDLLDRGFMLMLGVVGLLAVAAYARFYLVSSIGERVTADIRREVFARVIAMDMGYFETTRTGELLSRLTADTVLLQSVLVTTVAIALRNGLLIAGGTALLMLTSHKLTLMVVVMLPIVILPILFLGKRVRYWSRETQTRLADVNAEAEETVYGIRTLQSFSLEAFQQARFGKALDRVVESSLTRIRLRSWLTAIVIGLVFGAVMTVLWMGGRDVLAGEITPGQLSSFVFYAVMVAGATGAISDIIGELQRAAGAAERLGELLVQQPEIASPAEPKGLPQPLRGEVRFAQVTFRYPSRPDKEALSQFDLTVRPGETVALVGPSGAGKTTVLQLLQRFYDPGEGGILLDGVDLRELALADLRATMALVPQDPVIFSATVGENIALGSGEWRVASDQIKKAAEQAAALEFIEKLPDGLDTYVGEKGVRLSGGQKQRLAIARALLRNPPILLLDEATSALDAENEQLVQLAIAGAFEGRTTLVIAHRLATVKRANRIVVMNEGRIEAVGTHEELLNGSALYARLAALQFTS